jgi:FkbM family methyltransferase
MDLYSNEAPFFTRWVVANEYLHEPFVVVDVGVQGGPHSRWKHLGRFVQIYGYDAISEVIEELNKSKKDNERYRALALGNEDGQRQFIVSANTYGNSFYSSEADAGIQTGITLGARIVEILRLDTIFERGEVPTADYIKLDCEGFEPEVIRGARGYLARSNVLCVTTETNFGISPVYPRTPFVEICEMLAEHRLLVFDLNAVRTARPSYVSARGRQPWPEPDIMQDIPRVDVGQPATFDFVFCRNFVAEVYSPHHFVNLPGAWLSPTTDKLIKSMINFELHGLMDCAVEIAEHFRAMLSQRFDVDLAISHLTRPPVTPRNTFDLTESLRMIEALRVRLRDGHVTVASTTLPLASVPGWALLREVRRRLSRRARMLLGRF